MKHKEFEQKVMKMLIAGEGEPYQTLQKQYEQAIVVKREFTGVGFFTDFKISDELVTNSKMYARVDDVQVNCSDGQMYLFILYVNDGKIRALEGYSVIDEWKYNYDHAEIIHSLDKRKFDLRMR